MSQYQRAIADLLGSVPFSVNTDEEIKSRKPTNANSAFLTNKAQGDWAERIVLDAINTCSDDYRAVLYGRDDSIAPGEPDFDEFFKSYLGELNTIGKRPDILVFRTGDAPGSRIDDPLDPIVERALAGIEVRSSSFLANEYAEYMMRRTNAATDEISQILPVLRSPPYSNLLRQKNPHVFGLVQDATSDTFRELDFRQPSYWASEELRNLTKYLKRLKRCVKELHKRDYLSITPKVEDLVVVNRWIQSCFGIRHFYLQVFFDKAYVIPFKRILELTCDPDNEGKVYSIEEDTKNQNKTVIKVNVGVGKEILGRIEMPAHYSVLKRLERGRLLYYVAFRDGLGYLDPDVFYSELIHGGC